MGQGLVTETDSGDTELGKFTFQTTGDNISKPGTEVQYPLYAAIVNIEVTSGDDESLIGSNILG